MRPHEPNPLIVEVGQQRRFTTVDLRLAAVSVGRPTITNCGSCHFYGGGGNNVKHGDLEEAREALEDRHLGTYASLADYVQELTEETAPVPQPLRHYIDRERGDLFMALGRYNGSRGQAKYPNLVNAAWRQWQVLERAPVVAQAP